jgi:hypothetical protein
LLLSEASRSSQALCGKCTTDSKADSEYWNPQLAIKSIQDIANWDAVPEVLEQFLCNATAIHGHCIASLSDYKIAKSLLSLKQFSDLDEAGGSRYLPFESDALINLQIIKK